MSKMDNFIFPTDISILDYEVDFEMPIILRREFLSMGIALVDMETGELTFNVRRTMKQRRKYKANFGNKEF